MFWRTARRTIEISKPVILGILNVTPDSFSDGGRFFSVDDAVAQAERAIADGADIIDVGGESTRPQAEPVDTDEELRRVVPVVEALVGRWPGVPVSVDTTKSVVAAAALDAGAEIVNDVSAFRLDPRIGVICAERGVGVVLMHSRGGVRDMASFAHAEYDDAVSEVVSELQERVRMAKRDGVTDDRIVLDPGIGFAKRGEQSLAVLAALPRLTALGYPVLVGASRKRFIGEITGVKVAAERVAGSVGAHVAALARGARLFRVHDVREHRQALDVAWAVLRRAGAESGWVGEARA
jgi:dihydropteroate synthase